MRSPPRGQNARMRAFGDEIWRIALRRDVAALRRAAALLEREAPEPTYDAHRALAFALAVEGRAEEALAHLAAGATEGWPFAAGLAVDQARVWHLAGDGARALAALDEAARGADRTDPAVVELASLVVSREPGLRRRALAIVLSGGTAWQRVRGAAAVAAA
ncbi:MAG TPA: hypothetical protein VGC78_15710 [Gaiellaceae bacterium]|jgi:aminoglycoside phosphotransferase